MRALINVLDIGNFRPNKQYFAAIEREEDFREYMKEENKSRDVQLFYMDKLVEFLKKEIEANKLQKTKKIFIIYMYNEIWNACKFIDKFTEAFATAGEVKIVVGLSALY